MNEYRMYDGDMSIIPAEPPREEEKKKRKFPAWAISIIVVISILILSVVLAVAFLLGARLSGKLTQYAYRAVTGNNIVVTIPAFNQEGSIGALNSVVNIDSQSEYGNILGYNISVGSGAIISQDGLILTTLYAIDSEGDITVRLNNGEEHKAVIYKKDNEKGIAILKIDADNLMPIKIGDSGAINIGDEVSVVGHPVDDALSNPITVGDICGIDKDVSVESGRKIAVFQVDSSIIANSIGGLVLNKNGELIGIATGIFQTRANDIGIVTPINEVKEILEGTDNATAGETADETLMIGIAGLDSDHGIIIEKVQKDSPADKAGLKVDDMVLKVDGNAVTKIEEINKIKEAHKKGDSLKITIYRDGEMLEIDVIL